MKVKILLIGLFLFTIISDQVSKAIVDSTFVINEARSIIGTVLYLRYIKNPGIAFGLSFGNPLLMISVTSLVIIILGYFFIKGGIFANNIITRIAMVMVLGGAVGNLIDRLRMREVIDFIDMGIGHYRWPIYNFADVYVTIGMFLMIYSYVFSTNLRVNSTTNSSDNNEKFE